MQTSTELAPWARVFHPTDFSRGSHTAFFHALRVASSLDAELEIAHVSARSGGGFGSLPGVRETLRDWRASQGEDFPPARLKVRKTTIDGDDAEEAIGRYLDRHPAELLVLTTRQRKGLDRFRHGEIAVHLARRARRAALLIPRGVEGFVDRESGRLRLRRVLLPIDHQPSPRVTVHRLQRFLRRLGVDEVECRLLHVTAAGVEAPRLEGLNGDGKTSWVYGLGQGDPEQTILERAEESGTDLVVMASEGRSGLRDSLRGSMAERILRRARQPVLLLPRLEPRPQNRT